MKKIFTLLTFVFFGNALLFGQCPDTATPNPTNKTFNLNYATEADRDAIWATLESITFPAGSGCMCGETVTIPLAELTIDGPVGDDDVYRIRAITTTDDYFGGENGNFGGSIIFNMTDATSNTCDYTATSIYDINGDTPVAIFPNPVKDQLTLINGEGKVRIYNTLGQTVRDLTIETDQVNIQLADLLKGQYYLQVLKEDGTMVTKQFSKTY